MGRNKRGLEVDDYSDVQPIDLKCFVAHNQRVGNTSQKEKEVRRAVIESMLSYEIWGTIGKCMNDCVGCLRINRSVRGKILHR